MMTQLVLIRGIPGSGKSTLAEMFEEQGFFHIEADMFFMDGMEYKFDATKLGEAHQWCKNITETQLKFYVDVVVTNTFTTLKELRPYFDVAKKYNIIPTVILAQNQFQNVHNVPEDAMTRMRGRFQYDISSLFESKE